MIVVVVEGRSFCFTVVLLNCGGFFFHVLLFSIPSISLLGVYFAHLLCSSITRCIEYSFAEGIRFLDRWPGFRS